MVHRVPQPDSRCGQYQIGSNKFRVTCPVGGAAGGLNVRLSPMNLHRLVNAALLLLVAGCATPVFDKSSEIPISAADPSKHAFVVIAVGTQVPLPVYELTLSIRRVGDGGANVRDDAAFRPWRHRHWLSYSQDHKQPSRNLARPSTDIASFSEENQKGTLHVAVLPPGSYEIYDFGISFGNVMTSIHRPFFSQRFELKAGQALYLGRFIAKATFKITGPFSQPLSANVEVRDGWQEDSQLYLASQLGPRPFRLVDNGMRICNSPGPLLCKR
jgi:hypothetical protein